MWHDLVPFEVQAAQDEDQEQLHTATVSMTVVAPTEMFYTGFTRDVVVSIRDDDLTSATEVVPVDEPAVVQTLTGIGASFPPGAISSETTFEVAEIAEADVAAPPPEEQFTVKGSVVSYEPSMAFNQPVTIEFPLPPAVDLDKLQFVTSPDAASGVWEVVEGIVVTNTTAQVEVSHFSLYTLAEVESQLVFTRDSAQQNFIEDSDWVFSMPGMSVTDSGNTRITRVIFQLSNDIRRDCIGIDRTGTESLWVSNMTGNLLPPQETLCYDVDMTALGTADVTKLMACWEPLDLDTGKHAKLVVETHPDTPFTSFNAATLESVMQRLSFINTNRDDPATTRRRAIVRIEDTLSYQEFTDVTIVPGLTKVNDAPTLTGGRAFKIAEDSPYTTLAPGVKLDDPENSLTLGFVWITPIEVSDQFQIDTDALDDEASGLQAYFDNTAPADIRRMKISGVGTSSAYTQVMKALKFKNDGPTIETPDRTVHYEVTDQGGLSATASTDLLILPTNDPPSVDATADILIQEDTAINWTLAGGDPDSPADQVRFELYCEPNKGTVTFIDQVAGTFTYTPDPNANGQDAFTYEVVDYSDPEEVLRSELGMVGITIENVEDPPVAQDLAITVYACSAETVSLGCVDTEANFPGIDPDDDIASYVIVSEPLYAPSNLKLTDATAAGSQRSSPSSTFHYGTASGSYTASIGSDRFQYRIFDSVNQGSNVGTVNVTVIPFEVQDNVAPTAFALNVTIDEDATFYGSFPATDPIYTTLQWEIYTSDGTPEPQGTLLAYNYTDNQTLGMEPWDATLVTEQGLLFEYFPPAHWAGTDLFKIRIVDQLGEYSLPVEIRMNVIGQNDPPFMCDSSFDESRDHIGVHNRDHIDSVKEQFENTYGVDTDEGSSVIRAKDMTPETALEHMSKVHFSCYEDIVFQGVVSSTSSTEQSFFVSLLALDIDAEDSAKKYYSIFELPSNGTLYQAYLEDVGGGRFEPRRNESVGAIVVDLQSTRVDAGLNPRDSIIEVGPGTPHALVEYVPDQYFGGLDRLRWVALDTLPENEQNIVSSPVGTVKFRATCPPGTIHDKDNSVCVECNYGEYNSPTTYNQKFCESCSPGYYTAELGSTACTACAAGTYADSYGSANCTLCSATIPNRVSPEGSTSEWDCQCAAGFWVQFPFLSEWDGNVTAYQCAECLDPRQSCVMVHQPIPLPALAGVYIDPTTGEALDCVPAESCVIWTDADSVFQANPCALGYDVEPGQGCILCAADYYHSGSGGCSECPNTSVWVYVIGAFVLLAFIPILMKIAQMGAGFGALNIAIGYAQVLSVMREFDFNWPKEMQDAFDKLAVFNLDLFQFSPPECMVSYSWLWQFWMVNAVPLLFLALLVLSFLIVVAHDYVVSSIREPLITKAFPKLLTTAFGKGHMKSFTRARNESIAGQKSAREGAATQAAAAAAKEDSAEAEVEVAASGHGGEDRPLEAHDTSVDQAGMWRLASRGTDMRSMIRTMSKVSDRGSGEEQEQVQEQEGEEDKAEKTLWEEFELLKVNANEAHRKMIKETTDAVASEVWYVRWWYYFGVAILDSMSWDQILEYSISVQSAAYLFMSWGYFFLAENTLTFFDCTELNGKLVLRVETSTECYADLHAQLLPVAIASFLLYPIGIFARFAHLLRSSHEILSRRDDLQALVGVDPNSVEAEDLQQLAVLTHRFGFIFKRYEQKFYYWELMLLGRKLIICVIATLLHNPLEQMLVFIFMLVLFTASFMSALPYDKNLLDVMEGFGLVSNILILFAGFLFYSELLTKSESDIFAWIIIALMVSSLTTMCIFCVADSLPNLRYVIRKFREERKKAALDKMREEGTVARTFSDNLRLLKLGAQLGLPPRKQNVLRKAKAVLGKPAMEKLRDKLFDADEETLKQAEWVISRLYKGFQNEGARQKKRTAAALATEEGIDLSSEQTALLAEAPAHEFVLAEQVTNVLEYQALFATAKERRVLESVGRVVAHGRVMGDEASPPAQEEEQKEEEGPDSTGDGTPVV